MSLTPPTVELSMGYRSQARMCIGTPVPKAWKIDASFLGPFRNGGKLASDIGVTLADSARDRCSCHLGERAPIQVSAEHVDLVLCQLPKPCQLYYIFETVRRTPILCTTESQLRVALHMDGYSLRLQNRDLTVDNMKADLMERGPIVCGIAHDFGPGADDPSLINQHEDGRPCPRGPIYACRIIGWNGEDRNHPFWYVVLADGRMIKVKMHGDNWGLEENPYGFKVEPIILAD